MANFRSGVLRSAIDETLATLPGPGRSSGTRFHRRYADVQSASAAIAMSSSTLDRGMARWPAPSNSQLCFSRRDE